MRERPLVTIDVSTPTTNENATEEQMKMSEPEKSTKTAITELIEAGVVDKTTLVLLLATREILQQLDEIKAIVGEFRSALRDNDQLVLSMIDHNAHGREQERFWQRWFSEGAGWERNKRK
jgi:hypothetical protein